MRPRPGQSIAATYPKAPLRLPSRLRAKQRARTRSRRLKAKFHLGGIYHGQEQKANTGGRLEAIMRLPAPLPPRRRRLGALTELSAKTGAHPAKSELRRRRDPSGSNRHCERSE